MTKHDVADALLELRRYVRSHPDMVISGIRSMARCITADAPVYYSRLLANLGVASKYVAVDPSLLEHHLYCAAFELRLTDPVEPTL